MSASYRSIFPMSQKQTYTPNDNIDFVMSVDKEDLLPGSTVLEGKLNIYNTGTTRPNGANQLYYDHKVGAHGAVRDITTEFRNLGVVENLSNYPRYVKHEVVAKNFTESLGTETDNCVDLRCATMQQAKAYSEQELPFSIQLRCAVNRASGPLSSDVTGQIRIRIRLAPNNEFLYGPAWNSDAPNYTITDLRLRYKTVPSGGKPKPVVMNVMHSYRTALESNNQNVSTFVPGLADSVSMSFISQNGESSNAANYLQMAPPPGVPPLGASEDVDTGHYGLERVYYAVNDTDTALVGFTLESREEIVMNGLRAMDADPGKWCCLIRDMQSSVYPDSYLAGIPFGGLLDFTSNKFAAELQSQCNNQDIYSAYFYFRTQVQVGA